MLTRRQHDTLDALCRRIAPAAYVPIPLDDLATAVATRLESLTPFHRGRFCRALDLIGNRLFVSALAGRLLPFHRLPAGSQDHVLARCADSRFGLLRLLFFGVKRLIVHTWYASAAARAEIGMLPPLPDRAPTLPWEGPLPAAAPTVASQRLVREQQRIVPAGVIEGRDMNADISISADVCIIGSGVGGSVAACILAEAGHDVVIIESGVYATPADYPTDDATALRDLYAEAGLRGTDDLSVSILQGHCAGGGSTINWMVMLRTPDYVLEEWQRDHGVENMSAAELRAVFGDFERENGVGLVADEAHSPANRILLDGSRALGWRARAVCINARDCMRSGLCGMGCPYDAKQGMLKTYLARALDAGARLYCDTRVDRIESRAGQRRVSARCGNHQVSIKAGTIVVAGGAVETPALLQRSGLGNANVGRHLRLHPTTALLGVYEQPMHAGNGIPLSTYCDEFTQLHGDYGHWIETAPFGAALAAIGLPGFGEAHRQQMHQYAHLAPLIVLVRDGSPADPSRGSVQWQRSGRARVRYALSAGDRRIMAHGITAATRIHEQMGARSVIALQRGGDPMLFSAHVNGTCRMGGSPRTAACAPDGMLYGHHGVYVMDGSLLPTAPGVNPHETIAAVTTVLSRMLKDAL